jgi:hypothetical protein
MFAIVVYLAIKNDPKATGFIKDRLAAISEIDNAQPPHAHGNGAVKQFTGLIGSAMQDGLQHRRENL